MKTLRFRAVGLTLVVLAVVAIGATAYAVTGTSGAVDVDACALVPEEPLVSTAGVSRAAWTSRKTHLDDDPRNEVSTCVVIEDFASEFILIGIVRPGRAGFTTADEVLDGIVHWPAVAKPGAVITDPGIGEKSLRAVSRSSLSGLSGSTEVHIGARQGAYGIQVDVRLEGLGEDQVVALAQTIATQVIEGLRV